MNWNDVNEASNRLHEKETQKEELEKNGGKQEVVTFLLGALTKPYM